MGCWIALGIAWLIGMWAVLRVVRSNRLPKEGDES